MRFSGLLLLASMLCSGPLSAQIVATATLNGTVFVGEVVMTEGTVMLHHLTDGAQGDRDSIAVSTVGAFSFPLPNVPDPEREDVFFASVRHDGVLYFGPAITSPIQLDSVYEIHAYDTLTAASAGEPIPLQSRSVFFEPDSAGWRVTDLFQLRNDEDRTIVARSGGLVWHHPLPSEARDVAVGEGEVAFDAATYEEGELVVRAALPPGERIFVVRYRIDSPIIDIPNLGTAESFDILVREPAPALEAEGLELVDRVELEAGSTYMRFSGSDISMPFVRVVEADEGSPLPVEWVSVILALVLTGGGLLALRGSSASPGLVEDRQTLLLKAARLDDEFERGDDPALTRSEYRHRREEIIRKLQPER
jgi:hypothetical protein